MQIIIVTAMRRQRLERVCSNHGTTDMFDVRVVGPPEIPFFQLYFRPPRMRSSRGLIFLPITSGHSQYNGRCKFKEAFNMTDLATSGVPMPFHGCHLP